MYEISDSTQQVFEFPRHNAAIPSKATRTVAFHCHCVQLLVCHGVINAVMQSVLMCNGGMHVSSPWGCSAGMDAIRFGQVWTNLQYIVPHICHWIALVLSRGCLLRWYGISAVCCLWLHGSHVPNGSKSGSCMVGDMGHCWLNIDPNNFQMCTAFLYPFSVLASMLSRFSCHNKTRRPTPVFHLVNLLNNFIFSYQHGFVDKARFFNPPC